MLNLLLIIGLILFVLWILGFITSFTFGGAIHILFVIGIIFIVIWIISYLMRRGR